MSVADELFALFREAGDSAYYGEVVSTTEHCLQAAHFAALEGAPPGLVAAALLHDIGHLLQAAPNDIAEWTRDARHEITGSRWLAQRFAPEVSEPVRLHVPAKRYLCATDPGYAAMLSPASAITLKLQGGPMSLPEVRAFEAERHFREAVRLRHWDDQGKIAGLLTASLADHRVLIESLGILRGT
ncbi:MAG: HD domain-containing protein [Steroidobacteraceae bacterium]|jgi:gamma-butyrobetaine dioxygenase